MSHCCQQTPRDLCLISFCSSRRRCHPSPGESIANRLFSRSQDAAKTRRCGCSRVAPPAFKVPTSERASTRLVVPVESQEMARGGAHRQQRQPPDSSPLKITATKATSAGIDAALAILDVGRFPEPQPQADITPSSGDDELSVGPASSHSARTDSSSGMKEGSPFPSPPPSPAPTLRCATTTPTPIAATLPKMSTSYRAAASAASPVDKVPAVHPDTKTVDDRSTWQKAGSQTRPPFPAHKVSSDNPESDQRSSLTVTVTTFWCLSPCHIPLPATFSIRHGCFLAPIGPLTGPTPPDFPSTAHVATPTPRRAAQPVREHPRPSALGRRSPPQQLHRLPGRHSSRFDSSGHTCSSRSPTHPLQRIHHRSTRLSVRRLCTRPPRSLWRSHLDRRRIHRWHGTRLDGCEDKEMGEKPWVAE